MRRLSITANNLQSYNSLYALGGIRKDQRDRTINFTTENDDSLANAASGKKNDFASSTVTDLRQMMLLADEENKDDGQIVNRRQAASFKGTLKTK